MELMEVPMGRTTVTQLPMEELREGVLMLYLIIHHSVSVSATFQFLYKLIQKMLTQCFVLYFSV